MNVTFIHHSSFLVETPSAYLLFDYFRGSLPALNPNKRLYVLSSHAHSDHYAKVIYSFPERHPEVHYILSTDVPKGDVPESFQSPVVFLGPHEEYHDDLLRLTTLRSNDRGVAFVCEADGLTLYHGGDLNNWCWDDGEVAKEDERIYHEELSRIEGREFDAAFVPLDTRLEGYEKGIEDFMKHCSAKAVFPMHVWGKFEKIKEFVRLSSTASYRERVRIIAGDGQEFTV